MSNARILKLSCLVFALGLGGCPVYPASEPPCQGDGCYCETDADCTATIIRATGYTCDPIWNECARDLSCDADAECLADEICVEGSCVADESCKANGDCDAGAVCDAGQCTPGTSCTADSDCESGDWCDFRGTCVTPAAGACRTTSDCSGDAVCVEGACRTPDTTCQFNYQCGAARACVNNACVPICVEVADCAGGMSCEGGFCTPVTGECGDGSGACGSGETCSEGRCLETCETSGDACADGTYCADDGVCRPEWQPQPFCSSNVDCAEGHNCVDGACRTPCAGGADSECLLFDSQLPICGEDLLCYAPNELAPECASANDCTDGDSCINAICR